MICTTNPVLVLVSRQLKDDTQVRAIRYFFKKPNYTMDEIASKAKQDQRIDELLLISWQSNKNRQKQKVIKADLMIFQTCTISLEVRHI